MLGCRCLDYMTFIHLFPLLYNIDSGSTWGIPWLESISFLFISLVSKLCLNLSYAPNSLFGSPRKSRPTRALRSPSLILYQHKCWTTCLAAPHLLTRSTMNTKHRSPAKKARNSKRLIKFLQSKISCKDLPNLVICSQPSISLVPLRPKLSFFKPPSTSVPPIPPPRLLSTSVQTSYPSLSQVKNEGINIRPRKIYHPV